MTFIQARHFYDGRTRPLRLFVWHDMEAAEHEATAENVARYFATTTVKASAHICVDNNSVVECVAWDDTAWAAPGANSDGYQIELAGYARQSHAEWTDGYSLATITNAARHIAPVAKRVAIPPRWLTDAQLRDGVSKGHVTHAQVSRVFKKSSHTDPGGNFPADFVMKQVVAALGGSKPPPPAYVPPKPPPVSSVPAFPREKGDDGVIQRGDQGREVVAVQARFKARGWKVDVDAHFGAGTEAIVRKFQAEKHLGVDGKVGPATWRAMWTASR